MTRAENPPSERRITAKKVFGIIKNAVLPILILLLGVGTVIYYITGPAEGYMTSDCTDSLNWAYETFVSGKLIGDNFYYAAILPFGGNLIFLPYIALFGYSMKAQILGLCTLALLLAAAAYYMARGFGLSRIASASTVTLVLLIMSSSAKLREIMWEHIFYYNLGILFFCVGFGLAVRIFSEGGILTDERKTSRCLTDFAVFVPVALVSLIVAAIGMKTVVSFCVSAGIILLAAIGSAVFCTVFSKKKPEGSAELLRSRGFIRAALLLVFSLMAATDGLQTLVCFTLPVLAGIFAERLFDSDTKFFSKGNLRIFAMLALIGAASVAGYMLIGYASGGVTAGYANAYSSYSAMNTWKDNFLGFFTNWLSLLGVSVKANDPLVSLDSILNMIRILGSFLLLAAPVVMLFFYKKIKSRGIRAALIGHFAVSAFILFAVTFGRLGGANWRLTPMLGTAAILSAVSAFELIRQKGIAQRLGACLLSCLILVSAVSFSAIAKMPADYGQDNVWHLCVEELEARDLKYGYANFWWAESMTMFSDRKVEIANIYENSPTPRAYKYQVPKDCFDDKEGVDRYFILLTADEYEDTMRDWIYEQQDQGLIADEFVIETGDYSLRGHSGNKIFVFVFNFNPVKGK